MNVLKMLLSYKRGLLIAVTQEETGFGKKVQFVNVLSEIVRVDVVTVICGIISFLKLIFFLFQSRWIYKGRYPTKWNC